MKVSKEIESLVPYKPGKPISETQRQYGLKEVYKLASNENALGPSEKVVKALQLALFQIHRYPDAGSFELIQKLSHVWKVDAKELALGNGSNEIIDLLIRIYCEKGDAILTSQAAFVAYKVCAQAARVAVIETPMTLDFKIDLEKIADTFLNQAQENKIKIIFIPNPNNPTGTYNNQIEVENFLNKVGNREDVLIVFDEAYNDFVRATDYKPATEFFSKYFNVIVLRTFSKVYGLGGLRLGAMIAPEETIEIYNRVRNPFNVNLLAQVAATVAVDDAEYIKKSQEVVWTGLDYFYKELAAMKLKYVPSQANFVLFDTGQDVVKVNESLLKQGIILRPVLNYGFKTYLRMSVGLENENHAAIEALRKALALYTEPTQLTDKV